MKKAISLFLIVAMCFSVYACGTEAKLSGKYYSEDITGVYYEFDGKSSARLVIEKGGEGNDMAVSYVYVINDEDVSEMVDQEGAIHKTYVVHISDKSSDAVHKLIFDSKDNIIWDEEIGIFSKK